MKTKWYPVPPYSNEGWKIYNEDGELIATFEDKEDCIEVVKLHNESLKPKNYVGNNKYNTNHTCINRVCGVDSNGYLIHCNDE